MSEQHIDYFRDPSTGGVVHDSNGPLWTVRSLTPNDSTLLPDPHADYRDLPAWCQPDTIGQHSLHSRYAMLTGAIVLLCNQCHLPVRKDSNGRLVAMIERYELTFVPERYCACERE